MRRTISLAIGLAAVFLQTETHAGPLVLEETTRIDSPEAPYLLGGPVALDGDSLIAAGSYALDIDESERREGIAAFLFQRNANGTWSHVRKLMEQTYVNVTAPRITVAMRQGVAAVSTDRLYVFERTPAGWVSVPAPAATFIADDLEIDAGTILATASGCEWRAQPFRKTPAGQWDYFGQIVGSEPDCRGLGRPGDGDISGNQAILFNVPDFNVAEARIFDVGASLPWVHSATLTRPDGPLDALNPGFGPALALRNGTALVSGTHLNGTYVFDRNAGGVWESTSRIRMPELSNFISHIRLRDQFALQSYFSVDHQVGVVSVLQRQADGAFRYVARLVASQPQQFGIESLDSADISGRVVAAGGNLSTYVFELPADFSQPAIVQDDFESGNASRWTPVPGSSFSVVSSGSSRVYRQSSLVGGAASLLTNVNWRNQAIEADITPRAFSGADRWFGLTVRRTDADNYYYVTLRSSNVIQLRRMVNGVFSTIASQPLPITLNRVYRVRLEAIGTSLKVYLDGRVVLIGYDDSLPHGQPGVAMFKARADFDNVVVTPNHFVRLFNDDFQFSGLSPWTRTGTWQTDCCVLRQTSLDGGARAITGVSTEDQVVQVRARADGFSGNDRWFGVVARYQDEGNYYYLTVRNSNQISLRKLVNGTIFQLASRSMSVTPNTWYDLRLAVVGDTLRAWVNGRVVLQATDTTHASGRFGLAMFKTAASYDDFIAYQP